MSLPWYAKGMEEVLHALNMAIQGLSRDEFKRRLDEYGLNELNMAIENFLTAIALAVSVVEEPMWEL